VLKIIDSGSFFKLKTVFIVFFSLLNWMGSDTHLFLMPEC